MRKAKKKPAQRGDPKDDPHEELRGKSTTEAEANFNLVNFVETLITMDRQHQEWLEKQKHQSKENA